MENAPWQIRAKRAGLSQRDLAALTGVTANSLSIQLRGKLLGGVPAHLQVIILAWEMLSYEQRTKLREEMAPVIAEISKRRSESKRKAPKKSV